MQKNPWCMRRICAAATALLLLGLTAQTDLGEPFGLSTVAAPEGPLWVTWRDLQSQMKAEQAKIEQCRREPKNCSSAAALKFIAIVDEGKSYEALARIGHINRTANFAIGSFAAAEPADNKRTSPLAALAVGTGDCKQFSVLKYAALIAAGFAEDDVRLLILNSKLRHDLHAVAAVLNDGRWVILDNRSLALADSNEILGQYIPLYALDHRGIRQFVPAPRVTEEIEKIGGAACASDDG